jgi:hypothetical protein
MRLARDLVNELEMYCDHKELGCTASFKVRVASYM